MDVAQPTPSAERVFFYTTNTNGIRNLHTLSEPVYLATPVSDSEKYTVVNQVNYPNNEGLYDRICNYLLC